MPEMTILHPTEHAGIRAAKRTASLGAARHFVEITPRELPLAAVTFPILVTKNADTGAFLLGAVLGVDEGENLYVDLMDDGDAYRPLHLQREGFWILREELAADLAHPRFNGAAGEPLYDNEGAPTAFLAGVADALRELRSGAAISAVLLPRLAELGLLTPIEFELSFDDGTRRTLEDLYSIDQDALQALDDAAVLELFRRGYLRLVYSMIASLKNVPRLAKLKNARLGMLV